MGQERRKLKSGDILAALLVLVVSIAAFLGRHAVSDPGTAVNKAAIVSLDRKQDTTLELTAAATGASLAVSMLPGDVGTPIAEELADIASKLSIALAAIFLEKYLLTVFEYTVFGFLLPLCGLMWILYIISRRIHWKRSAVKLLILSIVLCGAIPLSEHVSTLIRRTYETSITETIAAANETTAQLSGQLEEEALTEAETDPAEETESEKQGMLNAIGSGITNAASSAASAVTGIADSAVDLVSGAVLSVEDTLEEFRTILNRFIEAVAIMIVLCCGLPVVTAVLLAYTVKQILELNFDAVDRVMFSERERRRR